MQRRCTLPATRDGVSGRQSLASRGALPYTLARTTDAHAAPPPVMPGLIGVIPAAGRGVRAYPYTATIPKCMLEVDGVPLVRRNVELMRDQLGIRDVRIVTGHQGDVIRRYFGNGDGFGVRISYVENTRLDLELAYS